MFSGQKGLIHAPFQFAAELAFDVMSPDGCVVQGKLPHPNFRYVPLFSFHIVICTTILPVGAAKGKLVETQCEGLEALLLI